MALKQSGLSIAFRLGTEMLVATLMGALMGWTADHFLSTEPWFLILGVLMGGAAGCLNAYRAAQEADGGQDTSENNHDDNRE